MYSPSVAGFMVWVFLKGLAKMAFHEPSFVVDD
jgi:hypothetical protein